MCEVVGLMIYGLAVVYTAIGMYVDHRYFQSPIGYKAWVAIFWPIALLSILTTEIW